MYIYKYNIKYFGRWPYLAPSYFRNGKINYNRSVKIFLTGIIYTIQCYTVYTCTYT